MPKAKVIIVMPAFNVAHVLAKTVAAIPRVRTMRLSSLMTAAKTTQPRSHEAWAAALLSILKIEVMEGHKRQDTKKPLNEMRILW